MFVVLNKDLIYLYNKTKTRKKLITWNELQVFNYPFILHFYVQICETLQHLISSKDEHDREKRC